MINSLFALLQFENTDNTDDRVAPALHTRSKYPGDPQILLGEDDLLNDKLPDYSEFDPLYYDFLTKLNDPSGLEVNGKSVMFSQV